MMIYFRHGIPHAVHSLASHWRASLNTVLILCASLTVLGLISLLYVNIVHFSESWLSNTSISLFLKSEMSGEAKQALLQRVKNHPLVKNATLVTPEEGLRTLAESLGANHRLLSNGSKEFLPYTIDFELFHNYRKLVSTVSEQFKTIEGVSEVIYTERLLDRVELFFTITQGIGLFLVALILMSFILVMSHATRLSLYARREEIEIMDLIGATKGFIRSAFVMESMLIALIAGLISLGVMVFCFKLTMAGLGSENIGLFGGQAPIFLTWQEGAAALALVALLGAFSSRHAVNRVLRELEH